MGGDASLTAAGAVTVNKLQGNTLTITTPTSGQYLRYNGTAFVNSALQASDVTGTLFTLAASSGASQAVTAGSTVSILKGSSNNLTTTASATDTVTVDIVANPTFTGTVTSSNSAASPWPRPARRLPVHHQPCPIGRAISGGNANGTYLGLNAASGYSGDLLNFQVNNASQLKVTGTGNLTLNGTITANTTNTINGLNINAGALGNITGYTQTSGNFDASASTGTFKTSTGAVTLGGATTASSTLTATGLLTASNGLTLSTGNFDAR